MGNIKNNITDYINYLNKVNYICVYSNKIDTIVKLLNNTGFDRETSIKLSKFFKSESLINLTDEILIDLAHLLYKLYNSLELKGYNHDEIVILLEGFLPLNT